MLLAAAALMGSPGPSTISVTAVGAAFGLRRAMPYVAGLILGTTAVLLAVATGLFAALSAVPRAAPVLSAAAALYILWLAVRIARAPPLARDDPSVPAPSVPGGLLLATTNPKAWIVFSALFAASHLRGLPPVAEAVAKTLALVVMIVAIHLAWLLVGASLELFSIRRHRPAPSPGHPTTVSWMGGRVGVRAGAGSDRSEHALARLLAQPAASRAANLALAAALVLATAWALLPR